MRLPRLRSAARAADAHPLRTLAVGAVAGLAVAVGATALTGPDDTAQPAAATTAEACEAIGKVYEDWQPVIEYAELFDTRTGSTPAPSEATVADGIRRLVVKAVFECVAGVTTTTTTNPDTTTSSTVGTTTTIPPPTTTTTTPTGTPPGLPVDESAIPAPAQGLNGQRIICSATQLPTPPAPCPYRNTAPVTDGVAAFRTNCGFSHMAFDDPLAAPGQPRGSHLHSFFGNQAANAYSTTMNTGGSTCDGGTANRTGYWVPTMVDTGTDRPVTSFQNIGPSGDGPEGFLADQVYYKSGYQGVPASAVQPFPPGLRMIAGDPTRTGPGLLAWQPAGSLPAVQFACTPRLAFIIPNDSPQSIPTCTSTAANPMVLQSVIRFPQCWNGRDTDSADHRSHMAYSNPNPSNGPIGCPASHPVPLPEITIHERLAVPVGTTTARWARTSDTYLGTSNPTGNAGYSFHADWWNGWDQAVLDTWVGNCYRPQGADCGFTLGDGRELWQ